MDTRQPRIVTPTLLSLMRIPLPAAAFLLTTAALRATGVAQGRPDV